MNTKINLFALNNFNSNDTPTRSGILRLEQVAVCIVLALFIILQANNIRNNAFLGQDFYFHNLYTIRAAESPNIQVLFSTPDAPLLYLMGATFYRLTGGEHYLKPVEIIITFFNLLALVLFYMLCRILIRSPLLRIAALVFFTFLPVTIVTTMVYAGDALTLLPFFIFIAAFLCLPILRSMRSYIWFCVGITAIMALANLSRYTFIALVPVVPIGLISYKLWNLIDARRLWSGLLIMLGIGGLLCGGIRFLNQKLGEDLFIRPYLTGEMTLSSMFVLKPADVELLNAPTYWEGDPDDKMPWVLHNNRYSYPALLHLGIFTDLLTFANVWTRTPEKQALNTLSVRTGILFSLTTLAASLWTGIRCLKALFAKNQPQHVGIEPPTFVLFLSSCAMFFIIFAFLPFVDHAYTFGTWTPRYILTAIAGFSIILFYSLDQLERKRRISRIPVLAIVILVAVVLQSVLHISLLWYTP